MVSKCVITYYLGDLQLTYIGVIIQLLSTMDIQVSVHRFFFGRVSMRPTTLRESWSASFQDAGNGSWRGIPPCIFCWREIPPERHDPHLTGAYFSDGMRKNH